MRVLAFLVSLALVQVPQSLLPTRDQFLALFGSYVDTLRVQAGIPGLAGAIVGDTGLLWQQAFGVQDTRGIAARTDTPFHFDGLTQLVTATLVLQCLEQGRVSLDTPVGVYTPSSPDAAATIRQVLSHTSGSPDNLAFRYNTARLDTLKFVVETCSRTTFRQAFRNTIERLGMVADSVPGPDAASPDLPAAELATPAQAARYLGVFGRLATPYAVSAQGVPTSTQYTVKTLGGGSGLVSTVLDFAKFDIALRQQPSPLLRRDTLMVAWSAPVNAVGLALPHGLGWFVQNYNGELVVWQYGVSAGASSSLVITLPNRNVTLILLANSDGLAKPASLSAGDVTVSPFAKVFLGLVVK